MAQKKRLGKDPFASTAPTPEPEAAAPIILEAETKATPARKPRTAAKKPVESKAAAPAPTTAQTEKPDTEMNLVKSQRDTEIEMIKRELSELQALVMMMQQQIEAMKQWNDTLFSPWQWWFSLFS